MLNFSKLKERVEKTYNALLWSLKDVHKIYMIPKVMVFSLLPSRFISVQRVFTRMTDIQCNLSSHNSFGHGHFWCTTTRKPPPDVSILNSLHSQEKQGYECRPVKLWVTPSSGARNKVQSQTKTIHPPGSLRSKPTHFRNRSYAKRSGRGFLQTLLFFKSCPNECVNLKLLEGPFSSKIQLFGVLDPYNMGQSIDTKETLTT